jgi:very-short-patch-repair endonuclease
VEVIAENSPYKGRKIVVYTSDMIESLICTYALAFANDGLRQNQRHIGQRCILLQSALIRTVLDSSIKEDCGIAPQIQEIAQKHYMNAVEVIEELGFRCSVPNRIATKQDIAAFLKVPTTALNYFLHKHKREIQPKRLPISTIRAIGSKAKRMNGYSMDDVAKIVVGINSGRSIEIKDKLFDQAGALAKPARAGVADWKSTFANIFSGLGFCCDYPIGSYTVDYFVSSLSLVLECHNLAPKPEYGSKEEKERTAVITQRYDLIRFDREISIEQLFNGILYFKFGKEKRVFRVGRDKFMEQILSGQRIEA